MLREFSVSSHIFPEFPGRFLRRSVLAVFCVFLVLPSLRAQNTTQPPVGLWYGTIQSKAGEVNFGIDLKMHDGKLEASLVNATDRQPFSSAEWNASGSTLTLRMNYYDGVMTLHLTGKEEMQGEYSRLTSKGIVHIPLQLRSAMGSGHAGTPPSLAGEWIFTWPEESGAEETTRASLQQPGGWTITGIIEPVSGDTGLLHGTVEWVGEGKAHIHLSRFDGIHTMAIDGELLPDGTLKGQQGGIKSLEPFTAVRATDTKTADPNALAETLTHVKDPNEPFRFGGIDQSGKTLTQDSAEFKGKPLIIDIFGTWCPNCHDEAPVLEELYRKYRDQGLQIVGLAYEYIDDTPRDLKQIAIYREKFGISFPLLLAGTTDQGQMAKTLPQLVGFGAFPTSIYVDRSGHVKAILAGFTGPSTGERFQEVQRRMDELAKEIVGQ
jgi:thiol-disulfide isomerase/thioredoxin